MSIPRLIISTLLICISVVCKAQLDSTIESLKKVPAKYISSIENKVDKYSNRITSKTEKTLVKLSRWENKIKVILEKVSPETAARLFSNTQMTFSTALQKLKEGESIIEGYKTKYNEYRDKLTTSIKYMEQQKDKLDKNIIKPVNSAKKKLTELEEDISNTEAVEQFIRERKKLLINEGAKYLGKSKYLNKIDKEAYYYVETLRNYREIFSDKKRAEEVAIKILNRIPGFTKFTEDNSMLSSLFGNGSSGSMSSVSLAGLQTRVGVNSLIQSRIAAGGPNAQQYISQSMQAAQTELSSLKDKVLKYGGNSSNTEIPNFKPNQQRAKTFMQRLEFNTNLQFIKNNSYVPTTADIGLSLGYKLNDKSLVGVGLSYKLGVGSIDRMAISHQGIGMRSFIDWKLKKQFYITGGYEMNYNTAFRKVNELKNYTAWQPEGLIGVSKKINVKTKFFKGTKVQLLYDMLAKQHVPTSQTFIFRMGYSF